MCSLRYAQYAVEGASLCEYIQLLRHAELSKLVFQCSYLKKGDACTGRRCVTTIGHASLVKHTLVNEIRRIFAKLINSLCCSFLQDETAGLIETSQSSPLFSRWILFATTARIGKQFKPRNLKYITFGLDARWIASYSPRRH